MRDKLTTLIVAFVLIALTTLNLTGCDPGTPPIKIQYRYLPGTRLYYQQLVKGTTRSVRDGVLYTDRYAESTMDIEVEVVSFSDEQIAELITRKTATSRSIDNLDTTSTDTVMHEPQDDPTLISYFRPNGQLVDIKYESDTVSASLEYEKKYQQQGSAVFPSGELALGHSWTQTTSVMLPEGPTNASTTFTLRSLARERGYDCVVIQFEGWSIVPLPLTEGKSHRLIGGVDSIYSAGHLYFALEEGVAVRDVASWHLTSHRTYLITADKEDYAQGDTVRSKLNIDWDYDRFLTKLVLP